MSQQQVKQVQLGIIGGSGTYDIPGLEVISQHDLETPFGKPSDLIVEGTLFDKKIFFLSRHGKGHNLSPSEVNYRANIFALKSLGVTHLLAISAVGIMREEVHPGHLVIPDQIFDRTKGVRASTFFEGGVVGHIEFADPFCAEFLEVIKGAAHEATDNVHSGGTYVCIEGPAFSTRAESKFYRKTLDPVIIGMTAIPEAKLAREAELAYGLLGLATDYDCWRDSGDDVSVEAVIQILKDNASLAQRVVQKLVPKLPATSSAPSLYAAKYAIISQLDNLPRETKDKLSPLFGNYLSP